MNGPEHYREAERLLASAAQDLAAGQSPGNYQEHNAACARAEVHATLAQVAATIEHGLARGRQGFDIDRAWTDAIYAIYAPPRGEQP